MSRTIRCMAVNGYRNWQGVISKMAAIDNRKITLLAVTPVWRHLETWSWCLHPYYRVLGSQWCHSNINLITIKMISNHLYHKQVKFESTEHMTYLGFCSCLAETYYIYCFRLKCSVLYLDNNTLHTFAKYLLHVSPYQFDITVWNTLWCSE